MATASVFICSGKVPDNIASALAGLPNLKVLQASQVVCRSFQVVRVPALVIYNTETDDMHETARAYGDKHVQELAAQASRS